MRKSVTAFRDLIYSGDLTAPIVEVDMSDFNDILVNFDHRIIFDMGNWSEINYKISFAEQIIAEQPSDKEGYLTMIGTNQLSFRNKADYESTRRAAKNASKHKHTAETQPVTETNDDEETDTSSADEPGEGDPDDVYEEAE